MKKGINKLLLLTAFFLIPQSCTSRSAPALKIKSLKFIGDVNLTSDTKFKNTLLGGLSGLVYHPEKNQLLAISDDRSRINPARFYQFKIQLTDKSFTLEPQGVIFLKDANGQYFKEKSVDFEGITLLKNGNLLISSEGDTKNFPRLPPRLIEFRFDGQFLKDWSVPEKFIPNPEGKQTQGPYNNLAFESLSSSLDGEFVFTGTEAALLQDGNPPSLQSGSNARLIRYNLNAAPEFRTEEYVYPIEPIPNPTQLETLQGDNGLVDFLAIDPYHFLSLERSWLSTLRKNVIKIFSNTLTEESTPVQKSDSLKELTFKPVKKKLLLDLSKIVEQLNSDWARLDNIEGICLGPRLKNGNYTLLLVSDNNFNKRQRTLFLAFEILPEG